MCRKIALAFGVFAAVSGGAQAASIDLAALGLELSTPILEANGGTAFYEPLFLEEFSADAVSSDLELAGFPGSSVSFAISDAGPNEFSIFFPTVGLDSYVITEIGFTDSSLEFLIDRNPLNTLAGGAGDRAFVRIESAGFNFAGFSDPLGFFDSQAATSYGIDVRVRGLALSAPPIAAVPLPAGIILLGSALAGLGLARRRQGRSAK